MISGTRKAAMIFAWAIMAASAVAQPGDRALDPQARILDVLFPVEVPQRPYFLKLALRFDAAATQLVIVIYPDEEKYWIRRCQVTTYSLNEEAKAQLHGSLSSLPPEASDDEVRAIAAKLKVEVSRFEIAPEALNGPLDELRSIKISPVLADRVSLDDTPEYEFRYDNWEESVHYSIMGSTGKTPQDELGRWMIKFKGNLPAMLKQSPPPSP